MAERTTMIKPTPLPTDGPLLVARNVTKSYGPAKAVEDVSITVEAGRVVGLLGANGAGKTTTISCIAALLVPDEGTVRLCGVSVAADRYRAGRLFGLAAQEIALYPELTGRTNLRFFGQLAGMARAEADRSIAELTDMLHLEPLLDRAVRVLSGGQKRLIHVAACLVHRPTLVLLDEPSSGLDLTARYDLLETIRRVAAAGAGVLLSSHQLGEVEQVCDDVIILHQGRVLAAGPLLELIESHGDPIVEVKLNGSVHWVAGGDISKVLAELPNLHALEAVTVVKPSLESVFLKMTGLRIAEGGEAQ
jgi:ABC-2 type transport system ATP-binding protein